MDAFLFSLGEGEDKGSDNDIPGKNLAKIQFQASVSNASSIQIPYWAEVYRWMIVLFCQFREISRDQLWGPREAAGFLYYMYMYNCDFTLQCHSGIKILEFK